MLTYSNKNFAVSELPIRQSQYYECQSQSQQFLPLLIDHFAWNVGVKNNTKLLSFQITTRIQAALKERL